MSRSEESALLFQTLFPDEGSAPASALAQVSADIEPKYNPDPKGGGNCRVPWEGAVYQLK